MKKITLSDMVSIATERADQELRKQTGKGFPFKRNTMEEKIKKLEQQVKDLREQVKTQNDWIQLTQKWVENQNEINKALKSVMFREEHSLM